MKKQARQQCLLRAAALSMAAMLMPDDGSAEGTSGLEEIMVTARKFAEDVQKAPVAITVLSADDIKHQSIQSFAGLAMQTPAVSISNGSTGDPNSPLISIRGQAQTSLALSVDAPVGLYTDGVYSFGTGGAAINHFLDIERVEILKGPQGTLYGRNTTGGAINIYTKTPVMDAFEGEATLGVGNFSRREVSGVVNAPLESKVAALRLAGGYYQRDGYGRDLLHDRDLGDEDTQVARASVLIAPADQWEILLRGNWQRSRYGGLIAKPIYLQPGGSGNIAAAIELYGPPPTPAKIANALALYNARAYDGDFYDVYSNFKNYGRLDEAAGSVTVKYEGQAFTLKSIPSYGDVDSDRLVDGAAVGVSLLAGRQHTFYHQATQELQATGSAFGNKLNYAAGAFYYWLSGTDGSDSTLLAALNVPVNHSYADVEVKSPAVYGQATYALLDNLNVTAGLRGTWEKKQVDPTSFSSVNPCTLPAAPPPGVDVTIDTAACRVRQSHSDRNLSYTFGLDWTAIEGVMLYAKTNRGYKSGGFNQRVTANPASIAPYDAEIATDYEVGIKSEWFGRRVRVNTDVYRTDYENIQRTVFSGIGGPPTTVTRNAAAATIDGAEIDISMAPLDALLLRLSGGYTRPKYDSFEDFGLDQRFQNFLAVSKWTYSVSAAYTVRTAFGELRPQVDWAWRSTYDLYPTEAPGTAILVANVPARSPGLPDAYRMQSAFGLLNAQLAVQLDAVDAEVRVYAKNILDKEYLTQAVSFVNAGLGFAYAAPGDPRTYGLSLTKRF